MYSFHFIVSYLLSYIRTGYLFLQHLSRSERTWSTLIQTAGFRLLLFHVHTEASTEGLACSGWGRGGRSIPRLPLQCMRACLRRGSAGGSHSPLLRLSPPRTTRTAESSRCGQSRPPKRRRRRDQQFGHLSAQVPGGAVVSVTFPEQMVSWFSLAPPPLSWRSHMVLASILRSNVGTLPQRSHPPS